MQHLIFQILRETLKTWCDPRQSRLGRSGVSPYHHRCFSFAVVAKFYSEVLNLVRDSPSCSEKKGSLEVSCKNQLETLYILEENIVTVSHILSSFGNRTVQYCTTSNVCLLTVLYPSMQQSKSWPQWYRVQFYLILATSTVEIWFSDRGVELRMEILDPLPGFSTCALASPHRIWDCNKFRGCEAGPNPPPPPL